MKMARAISINVKPRARCTAGNYSFHCKSQQGPLGISVFLPLMRQRHCRQGRSIYSVIRGVTVNRGKGDCLRPPTRISATAEKCVYQRVVKIARAHQVLAKLFDCLCPIICPQTGPLVDCGFCSTADVLETQGGQSRRQSTTNLIINSSVA